MRALAEGHMKVDNLKVAGDLASQWPHMLHLVLCEPELLCSKVRFVFGRFAESSLTMRVGTGVRINCISPGQIDAGVNLSGVSCQEICFRPKD